MELIPQIIAQGGLGLVAAVSFWLYITERNDHKETRKEKDILMEARRLDAKDTVDKISQPLSGISQTVSLMYDKLVAGKRGQI